MSEVAELHRLRDRVTSRLRDGDAAGAWKALLQLADAAQRPDLPVEEVQRNLAECLEAVCAWSRTAGHRVSFPRTVAETSTVALATSPAAASGLLLLVWPLLGPTVIGDVLEYHRPRLESLARQQLADPTGAPGVVQDAAVRILGELREPSTIENVVAVLHRHVRDRARTRGRQQVARGRRFISADDVRHRLGHTPDLEAAATLKELDELAPWVLSPDLRSWYWLWRRGFRAPEIASRLAISARTERQWRQRVIAILRAVSTFTGRPGGEARAELFRRK